MTAEAWFTRREGDTLSRRVESMDRDGTRGMELLAAQTADNSKAIGRLQQELHERFTEHTAQHVQEQRSRQAARRWRITTGIAAAVAVIAVFSLLLAVYGQVHQLHR